MNRNGYFALNIAILILWAIEVTANVAQPQPTLFWLYMLSDALLWNVVAMSYSRFKVKDLILQLLPPYIAGAGLFVFFLGISHDRYDLSFVGGLSTAVLPISTVILAYKVQPR